jgi:hypothetical protein
MMKGIVICFLWLVAANVFAAGERTIQTPCEKLNAPLSSLAYGVTTPVGWSCVEIKGDKKKQFPVYYIWKKGDKSIEFVLNNQSDEVEENGKNRMLGEKVSEPQKSVRYYTELFLADDEIIKRAGFSRSSLFMYPMPKAVLFGKNNDKVVVYMNSGEVGIGEEKKQNYQSASVYRKNTGKGRLIFSCKGCTPDEFFSLVINPVIQK